MSFANCSSSGQANQMKENLTFDQKECINKLVGKFQKIPTKCVENKILHKIQCQYPEKAALYEKYKFFIKENKIQSCDNTSHCTLFFINNSDTTLTCKKHKLELFKSTKKDNCECMGDFQEEQSNIKLDQDMRTSDGGIGKVFDWEDKRTTRIECCRKKFSSEYLFDDNSNSKTIDFNEMHDLKKFREHFELPIEKY
ncbi:MAG: hypothetical protein H7A23_23020 [Leptospiraceae bacterium]|nr:hypothetical protein [Leptospiraceae bacterium]